MRHLVPFQRNVFISYTAFCVQCIFPHNSHLPTCQRFSAPYGNSCRSRGGWRPVRSLGTAGRRCPAVATRLSCPECSPGEDQRTGLQLFAVLQTLERAQASSRAGHRTSTAACCFHTSAGDLTPREEQRDSQYRTLGYHTARQAKNQTEPFSPHSTEAVENVGGSRWLPETLEGGCWAHGTSDRHIQFGQDGNVFFMSPSKDSPAAWAGMRASSSATVVSNMQQPELSGRGPGGLPPFEDKQEFCHWHTRKHFDFNFIFF